MEMQVNTTETTTEPTLVSFALDADWQSEIANYNTYRAAVKEAMRRLNDPSNDEKEQRKRDRAFSNAQKNYANACMSIGWKIARELQKQGVGIHHD